MMKRAAVSTIKATLSACLEKEKAGEELLVMERGKPVAKLVPVSKAHDEEGKGAHLRDLVRAGLVRVGTGKLPVDFGSYLGQRIETGEGWPRCWMNAVRGDEVLRLVGVDSPVFVRTSIQGSEETCAGG